MLLCQGQQEECATKRKKDTFCASEFFSSPISLFFCRWLFLPPFSFCFSSLALKDEIAPGASFLPAFLRCEFLMGRREREEHYSRVDDGFIEIAKADPGPPLPFLFRNTRGGEKRKSGGQVTEMRMPLSTPFILNFLVKLQKKTMQQICNRSIIFPSMLFKVNAIPEGGARNQQAAGRLAHIPRREMRLRRTRRTNKLNSKPIKSLLNEKRGEREKMWSSSF